MAKRERKKNPCKNCGRSADAHGNEHGHFDPEACGTFEEARIFRASPSSVKTAGECWRKWAARALGKIVKTTEAQLFGDRLHGMAEVYLLTGVVPDQETPEGRLFVEGIPYLPKRRLRPEEVEGEISFVYDGVPWIGYYDWREDDTHTLGDHKTSSDPAKWGLTAETLPKDVQAGMYTFGSGWDYANLKWVYYAKKAKNAFPVEARLTHEDADKILKKYVPLTHEMQKYYDCNPEILTAAQLNEIPCNPAACDGWGKNCDFADQCTLRNFIPAGSLVRKEERNDQMTTTAPTPAERLAALQAKLANKDNGSAVNPPEAAKALEETKKEVKNEAPTTPAQTEQPKTEAAPAETAPSQTETTTTTAPPAETTPAAGRKGKKATDAPVSGTAGSFDDLTALVLRAKALGLKVTIETA